MPEPATNEDPTNVTVMPEPGQQPRATVSFLPVAFNAQTLWQSPCFWMLLGAGVTLAAVWAFRKKA